MLNTFFGNVLTLPYKLAHSFHKIVLLMFLATGAQADEIVIVAFGDSLTAGYGLTADQGFVPQLEIWLRANGADVRVVNASVSGDTTAGGLARIEWVLAGEVDAVILELGANDFLRGLSPENAAKNLEAIMGIISARSLPVLIAGMPAPANYGAEYKTEFDQIYPALALQFDAPLYPHFLNGIAQMQGQTDVMSFIQPDGLHPNAAGVVLVVKDIGPHVLDLVAGLE